MKQIFFTLSLILFFSVSAFAQSETSLCPTITIIGGGVVQPGEPMEFAVKVTDNPKTSVLGYEWKISAGTIASGQGTYSIKIDTTGLEGINITAEVKVTGLNDICANTASEVGSIMARLIREPLDNWGKLSYYEIMARIQNLYIQLINNPNTQGYITNYGTDKEVAKREKQIRKAIKYFKVNANRVTIVRGGASPSKGIWTVVWIVPPGQNSLNHSK